jgi:hypothetical protein
MSFQTVEDMQDRLRNMCDEIDCLKYELEKAASDERAKIVTYLKHHDPDGCWSKEIEAGEHLK